MVVEVEVVPEVREEMQLHLEVVLVELVLPFLLVVLQLTMLEEGQVLLLVAELLDLLVLVVVDQLLHQVLLLEQQILVVVEEEDLLPLDLLVVPESSSLPILHK
jgi:hypothetical protein